MRMKIKSFISFIKLHLYVYTLNISYRWYIYIWWIFDFFDFSISECLISIENEKIKRINLLLTLKYDETRWYLVLKITNQEICLNMKMYNNQKHASFCHRRWYNLIFVQEINKSITNGIILFQIHIRNHLDLVFQDIWNHELEKWIKRFFSIQLYDNKHIEVQNISNEYVKRKEIE